MKGKVRAAGIISSLLLVATAIIFCFLKFGAYKVLLSSPAQSIRAWYPNLGGVFLLFRPILIPLLCLTFLISFFILIKQSGGFFIAFVKKLAATRIKIPAGSVYLFLFFTLAIAFYIGESALRKAGYKPGRYNYMGCREVDTLRELKGKITDTDGIYKVSDEARIEIAAAIARRMADTSDKTKFDNSYYSSEVYDLVDDFTAIQTGKYKNRFSAFIDSLKQLKNISSLDSLIIQYTRSPINSDGYKSIEFKRVKSAGPSVLLIGDSYVWGHSTVNKTNGFADLLLTKGYTVYNTGISGTDPPQYLAIAEKYIPVLKPDFVVVSFNLSNDVQYFERKLSAGQPVIWATNAGFILGCPDGAWFKNKEEGYRLDLQMTSIPPTTLFNKFCRSTVLTTRLWSALLNRLHLHLETTSDELAEHGRRAAAAQQKIPCSNRQLEKIKQVCEQNGATFILVAIPKFTTNGSKVEVAHVKDFPGLLTGMQYEAAPFAEEDYHAGDLQHFNDRGHLEYAGFLARIIDSTRHAHRIATQ